MCVMISEYEAQCGTGRWPVDVPNASNVPKTEDDVEPQAIDLEAIDAAPAVLQL